MELNSVIVILGSVVSLYFAWQTLREMVVPRAAKWLLVVAGLTSAVGLMAARQVDRSNAGIHPEWIGTARQILSIELFVSISLFIVAAILIVRATKQAAAAEWPALRPGPVPAALDDGSSSVVVPPVSHQDSTQTLDR